VSVPEDDYWGRSMRRTSESLYSSLTLTLALTLRWIPSYGTNLFF